MAVAVPAGSGLAPVAVLGQGLSHSHGHASVGGVGDHGLLGPGLFVAGNGTWPS